jgi:hypothetical protein
MKKLLFLVAITAATCAPSRAARIGGCSIIIVSCYMANACVQGEIYCPADEAQVWCDGKYYGSYPDGCCYCT